MVLMAALSPGTSPPPVRMPMRFLVMAGASASSPSVTARSVPVSVACLTLLGAAIISGNGIHGTRCNRLEADESGRGMDDDAGRDACEIVAETALLLEPGAELRARQEAGDARGDPAGDEDAAPGAEGQRRVPSERSQHGAEQLERRYGGRTVAVERRPGDGGSVALRRGNAIERDDGAIEILQPGPR